MKFQSIMTCKAKTKSGTRCSKKATPFFYCKQHWKLKRKYISIFSILSFIALLGGINADVIQPLLQSSENKDYTISERDGRVRGIVFPKSEADGSKFLFTRLGSKKSSSSYSTNTKYYKTEVCFTPTSHGISVLGLGRG